MVEVKETQELSPDRAASHYEDFEPSRFPEPPLINNSTANVVSTSFLLVLDQIKPKPRANKIKKSIEPYMTYDGYERPLRHQYQRERKDQDN